LSFCSQALADLAENRGYRPRCWHYGHQRQDHRHALTGQLVERAGKSVGGRQHRPDPAGHSGSSYLDADALPEVWVLELSSFQLDGVQQLRAHRRHSAQHHAGPPGLARRHAGLCCGQGAVFGQQGLMVLNRDDPLVMAMRPRRCA
jgi:UDP-N-acetylmuramoylalanine--D-glutamate ligase